MGVVAAGHIQAHQSAGISRHGGFTQLQRVHFTQALEAGDVDLAALLFRLDTVQHACTLFLVQGVVNLLAHVDAVQRWHGHKHMAVFHQCREVAQEQSTDQGGDMQAVGIRIGKDAHLAVTQGAQIIAARFNTQCHGDIVNFLAAQHFGGVHFPGVHDLAAQRHDGLVDPVPGLLGRTARRVPFHQEDFTLGRIIAGTVGQFAGQCRATGDFLAGDFLGSAQTLLGVVDAQVRQLLCLVGVLIQPQGEGILDHTRHERGGLPGAETLLGLAGELRVLHLDAEHIGNPVPDIFRGQFDATGQQVAEFTELAHGFQQARAKTVYMGAALGGGNQVNVGFLHQLAAFRQPHHRPVHRFGFRTHGAIEGFTRYPLPATAGFQQVFDQTISELPGIRFTADLVVQGDQQSRAQHRFGAQQMLESGNGNLR